MRTDVAYAGVVTLASTATSVAPAGPAIWDMGGIPVPVFPALIGVFAALLVRIIVVTSPRPRPRGLRAYNIAVTLLTMLTAATWITDHQLGAFPSVLTGIGCGALGVGIVELGRSQFMAAIRAGFQTAFSTLSKSDPDR